MNSITWNRGGAISGLVAGSLLSVVSPAGAVTVLGTLTLENTQQLVTNGTSTVYSAAYTLPSAGTLTVTLTDDLVAAPLSQLDFSLLQGAGSQASLMSGPVSAIGSSMAWNFDVNAGSYTTVFQAAAAGLPGIAGFWLGQYSDTVVFTPTPPTPAVPLPPAGSLLVGGVGVLGAFASRGKRVSPATLPKLPARAPDVRGNVVGVCLLALAWLI